MSGKSSSFASRNPDKCQVRGHIFFEDVENITHSYLTLNHQQFNIYSSLFRYIYK